MTLPEQGSVEIAIESDIVAVRQAVREAATSIGFSVTDTTRIVTAASELARNVFKYGGGGVMNWHIVRMAEQDGIELTFIDRGPGITDVDEALQEGFTTGGGLGMGLPGAKRLMDEMSIESVKDEGTTVLVTKWRRT